MSGTQSQSEATSQTNPLRESLGWVAKHSPRIDLSHEGMMLESIQRGLRIREVAARNEITGDRTNLDGWPGHEGDDAVGVSIGDHIHYHVQAPPQQEAAAETQQPATQAPDANDVPEKQSFLTKMLPVIAGALLGTGIGTGAAMYFQPDTQPAATQPASPPAEQQTFTDTDTDTLTKVEAVQGYKPGDQRPEMPQ